MNESERRRAELLQKTRTLYSSHGTPPAVHPRYRAAFRAVSEEPSETVRNSLGLRIFLSLLLFVLFAAAAEQNRTIWNLSAGEIAFEIQRHTDISYFADLF